MRYNFILVLNTNAVVRNALNVDVNNSLCFTFINTEVNFQAFYEESQLKLLFK